MRGLAGLDDWAHIWQRGQWSCATLAEVMRVELIVVPGGTSILGASHRADWSIGVNERLVDTALFVPVVLHEAGHLLTEPRPVSGCRTDWRPAAGEQLAWIAAGRLSLSAEQGREIDCGAANSSEIAEDNGVPAELVNVGRAVLHRQQMGSHSLYPAAELGSALARWAIVMGAAVRTL